MAVCEILLALGLTFGGACEPKPAQPRGLPASDPAVFTYEKPEPPKPPAEAKIITMPPVIIEKEVIREVEAPHRHRKKSSEPKRSQNTSSRRNQCRVSQPNMS